MHYKVNSLKVASNFKDKFSY